MKYPNDQTHLTFSTMHLFLGKCMHPVDYRPFTAYDLLWILNISAARVVKFIMPSTATVEYMGNLGITLC
jgi:hypothetical protein